MKLIKSDWKEKFKRKQKQIIKRSQACKKNMKFDYETNKISMKKILK